MIQIKVKDLSFSYSGFRALQDISFEAGAGDMLAIIGQNGSGKSTLLKCISRILKINTGHIEIGNISLSALSASKLSRIVAYIPQSTDSISGINVFDTVLLGRKPYIHSRPAPEDMELVSRLLTRLELDEVAMRNLNTLSGGQQQRVFIARALAHHPAIGRTYRQPGYQSSDESDETIAATDPRRYPGYYYHPRYQYGCPLLQ